MTGIPHLSAAGRAEIRRRLRRRAGEFLNRFYRHDILMARAVRGLQLELMQRFRVEVAGPLVREVAGRLAGIDARGVDVSPSTNPELAALIREAELIIERGVASVRQLAEQRMRDVAERESEFVRDNARKTLDNDDREGDGGIPQGAAPQAEQAAVQRPFLGDNTERWFRKMLVEPTGDAVRQRITQGMQQGMTVDQIVRSIRGTRAQRGIMDASEQAVGTLVRTAATSASGMSRMETFRELGVTHWRFLATLDNRTSVQCAYNDGRRFKLGEGPVPPLHPNCRSTAVPDFGGQPAGTRASIDGQLPADISFEDWLRTRSQAEQNQVLGKTKAEAWRSGQLSLKQMLGRDLQPLTLRELKELDRL